ncbi:MAG: zinc-ribbon domain-containing protein [Verrucomicrobiae bacterium]|nr:zinc-ribbon domain-containing protein [Verrucomicrobiae bacterium]
MRPETCPQCGADVPARARACPECGADERTGWSDAAHADRLGLPSEEDFDHEAFVREEFGGERPPGRPWWWWLVAVVLLVALVFWLVL